MSNDLENLYYNSNRPNPISYHELTGNIMSDLFSLGLMYTLEHFDYALNHCQVETETEDAIRKEIIKSMRQIVKRYRDQGLLKDM